SFPFNLTRLPQRSTLFPYTTLFRSTSVYLAAVASTNRRAVTMVDGDPQASAAEWIENAEDEQLLKVDVAEAPTDRLLLKALDRRSEEHTSELQSRFDLVCRLLLEKK